MRSEPIDRDEKTERVFQAVVYAFEGKPIPGDLETHGMVRRAKKFYAAQQAKLSSIEALIQERDAEVVALKQQAEQVREQTLQTLARATRKVLSPELVTLVEAEIRRGIAASVAQECGNWTPLKAAAHLRATPEPPK